LVTDAPQHLADADLPGALLRYEGSEPEQPDTADEDSQHRKEYRQFTDPFFRRKFRRVFVVREQVVEGCFGKKLFEGRLDLWY
jgi:hypothetical protein